MASDEIGQENIIIHMCRERRKGHLQLLLLMLLYFYTPDVLGGWGMEAFLAWKLIEKGF